MWRRGFLFPCDVSHGFFCTFAPKHPHFMNIGDKVRFLNAVGGGRITGFQGKDLVLVTDEDGFEVPTLRHEIVVVDNRRLTTSSANPPPAARARKSTPMTPPSTKKRAQVAAGETHTSVKAALAAHDGEDEGERSRRKNYALADEKLSDPRRPRKSPSAPVPSSEKAPTTSNLHLAFVPADTRPTECHRV